MCLRRKGKDNLEFCLVNFVYVIQRALQFLHFWYSNVNSYSSASESNKQNPPNRTIDLPFFSRDKHIISLRNVPSPAPGESLPYWFQGNFAVLFVLVYCLREFFLS